MKVILMSDVPALGHRGETREVANGYARNFLLPRKLAVPATPANLKNVEHLKRLRKNGISPYFVPCHVHQLEIIERLIRTGVYMGPMNVALCGYGDGTMGRNPFDWMEMLRRTPHGASTVTFWSSMRGNIAIQTLATILGAHVRVATRTTSGT